MRRRSIQTTFFTSITTVLVASVLVMGLIQSFLAISYFRSEKEALLDQVVHNLADGFKAGELNLAGESMPTLGYMARVSGTVIFITGPQGVVRFSTGEYAPPPGTQVGAETLDTLRLAGHYREMERLGGIFSTNFYTSGVTLEDSEGEGVGFAFASADAAGLQVYLMDTMSTFILSELVVLLVSSILALVLTNRMVVPIRRLSGAAQRFADGDYSVRVPVQGDDELASLSVAFNEMASSVQATDISRRSFMGNIAHELRTPMTTIKGFIDGILDGTIPEEAQGRYLAIVSDEVGRLARLTKNMLDISRLEAGEYTPHNTVFDIWGIIAGVMLAAEQRLEDKSLEVLGLAGQQPVYVLADEDFVHQILFNLVDNAIKFAAEGGAITVAVNPGKAFATIGVRNTGSSIPEDALPHVFDRFYKADKSRGVNARGAGLGLHISKVLLGLMNGRIWAESVGDWTEFLFTLPSAPPKRSPRR